MQFLLPLGALGISIFVVASLFKDDEETVKTDLQEAENNIAETDSAEEADGWENIPDPQLRRGDRFICPDTGEELQVRAVGGRPRKNQIV